jgi:hypothetical protein
MRVLGECMKRILSGAALIAGLATMMPAAAAPGQCSVTGLGEFACSVDVDGGGFSFTLPDESRFAFDHSGDGAGLGYLIAADAQPGRPPEALGAFLPLDGQPGCWMGEDEAITVCVSVEQ